MEQAQCDQVVKNIAIKHGLTKQEQSLEIVITMIIHTRNEHPDMQANKPNLKYHLHVQHSTDTKIQGSCIKDIKSNKGTKVMY